MNTHTQPITADDDIGGLIERIRALQPMIRDHSAQGEQDRRLPEPVFQALQEAGAFKLGVPKRYGGYEGGMKDFLDVSSVVGEADGGAAWVVTLINICNFFTATMPVATQDKVFGANPNATVSGVLSPTAQSKKVDGGYRITGKWFYNSGGWHTDWALMGVPITDEDGNMIDQGVALMPSDQLTKEDTWFVAGMSASGSICMIADDVFVPDENVMSVSAGLQGQIASEEADTEWVYRGAMAPVFALVLVGPQLGLGRAAVDFVKSKAAHKPISYTFFPNQAASTGFQLQLAEAAMMIETAHLHAYRCAADIDAAAKEGRYPNLEERTRMRADVGLVADKVTRAIDILLSAHGAGSFAQVSPLQRIWRDSNVAARHAVVGPQIAYESYGKALLGIEEQITPLL
ncbi:acyl-CoA dehydrogenase family protein [Pseudooceanicola sp. MF1-13]|uniref:acyl-CoA dehydrogenase family protein n=1 Tax=Pseudooceanicola sp. MF1-13 TaxID=3379095 RepID=UPI0038929C76